MIVLHVARARTDSINIRGSLGKTRAALWITGATFLYFSECNAHMPFTLSFPSSAFLVYLCRFPVALLPFHDFSLPTRHRSPLLARHVATFLSRSRRLFRSLFLSFILDPSTCPLAEQIENRHSRIVSPFRIVAFSAEMETVFRYPIPGSYSRN